MNPYVLLGTKIGTADALSLSARLSIWHDAMVAHERRLRTGRTRDACDDECPHAQATVLWSEAVATFGSRAHDLRFLRSRATGAASRSRGGATAREPMSEAADTSHFSGRTAHTRSHRAPAGESRRTDADLEL